MTEQPEGTPGSPPPPGGEPSVAGEDKLQAGLPGSSHAPTPGGQDASDYQAQGAHGGPAASEGSVAERSEIVRFFKRLFGK
jgi:hypothetical protein